jgi:hypothetical protein
MPSQMYAHLSDADLAAVISYVRSVPERDGIEPELILRPLARIRILTGQFAPVATQIDARPIRDINPNDPLAHGRYLVMTACT